MKDKSLLKKLIIDIRVNNLDRAVKFYRDILELPLIHLADDWASFEVGGAEIHLYIHGGVGHSIEFRVSNILREVKSIKDKGVKFFIDKNQHNVLNILSDDIMEFSWGKIAFFKDSEGNTLALVEDK